ncbi:MAG: crotonase/enoyl-CoA hydratase family protein [Candidatus Eremiobacteraeota bacterium]|nr:crotonase/enoyl-CoA hydratase family protein [Candidatus Eremiobacteraeota bacterium]
MSVEIERDGPVLTVVINRPERKNAIDGPAAAALAAAFREFDADAQASVAVLCGAGGTFCSGADLKAFADDPKSIRLEAEGDGPLGCTRLLLSKPVIAAVDGYAVAGGLELALWCDLRVVERSATLGVFCRRYGVPLIDGGTIRLARAIGQSRALDLILTGRGVSGEEAYEMGLANRLAGDGEARVAATRLAHELAALPQRCLRSDRLSVYEQWSLDLDAALRNEFRRGSEVLASGETLAGAKAFVQGMR